MKWGLLQKDKSSTNVNLQSALSSSWKLVIPLQEQMASIPPPERRAVLVGIDGDYPINSEEVDESKQENEGCNRDSEDSQGFNTRTSRKHDATTLKGPKNDVRRLETLLIEKYMYQKADIKVLVDDGLEEHKQPTKENILDAIEWLVTDARPSDRLVFAFAGHGYQQQAEPGDEEEDGLNEFIATTCGRGIIDNLLNEKLVKPLPAGCKLTAIFDSCHSATMLDLEHSKCNRVYVPWVNKGKRRTRTQYYQTRRQVALMLAQKRRTSASAANSLEGRIVTSRESTLLAQTLTNNIHRNSSGAHNAGPICESPTSIPGTSLPYAAQRTPTIFVRNPRRKQRLQPDSLTGLETSTRTESRSMSPRRGESNIRSRSPSPKRSGESWIIDTGCDRVESPVSRFCDGNCRAKGKGVVGGEHPLADVICLSSSQDDEVTWEDKNGRSMMWHLIDILEQNPQPILENLMKDISHTIYDFYSRLHVQAREYRKERAASSVRKRKEKRRFSDLEITNFQRPELSSLIPLNIYEQEWDM